MSQCIVNHLTVECGGCEAICMWLGAYRSNKDIRTYRARLGLSDPPLYLVHDLHLHVTKKVHIMHATQDKKLLIML